LYVAFLAVTVSVVLLGSPASTFSPDDVGRSGQRVRRVSESADARRGRWRDIPLMRAAPWPFQIVGLHVWLVAAAVPCPRASLRRVAASARRQLDPTSGYRIARTR
jgi:hypothetical protein